MHPDSMRVLPAKTATAEATATASATSSGAPASSDGRAEATYVVAPGSIYPDLRSVAKLLKPGDIVDVRGNATYSGGVRLEKHGEADKPITIRGVIVDGKRPVFQGSNDTIEARGDNYIFEDLELTGATNRCFFHHAHNITVRRLFIHDCKNGLLGADDDSGSLLLEHSEFARSGEGQSHHQIYMATDERAHPGSVFRMQHCYIHDGAGGNNVKTRAERNEIRYNWIEGALFHELEMIGPDGADPKLAREDSEVLGNVFFKTTAWYGLRVGGDKEGGQTGGRYRILFNTFVLADSKAAVRAHFSVESVELYNNAIYRTGGGASVLHDDDAKWVDGVSVEGSNNWLVAGSTSFPSLKNTVTGKEIGFVNLAERDLRPRKGSPLIGAALPSPPDHAKHPFPRPTNVPEFEPSPAIGPPRARKPATRPSIGAFEP